MLANPFAGYLTVRQFAGRTGYTRRRVQQWIAAGRLPAIASPTGGLLIPETAWIPARGRGGNPKFRRKRKPQSICMK